MASFCQIFYANEGMCLQPVTVSAKETVEATTAETVAPAKPKPPAKAPIKPLHQLMEEDVIPSLKATLEAQDDILELELSFLDNRVQKDFLSPPTGREQAPSSLFSLTKKKITAKHVFWVEKCLAAQGIIPVWKD
ncbi:uncharacterized protein LOC130770990 [Actinidia eriantha]|uniref:uncharacterized protein LOC130770990 n=1 Tax=Actinidia eriantha TaxID=165200 RepID=UPI00259096D3|nr:uncharacterized protein LOC130770990 [Actinidia eriantha]